jgi:hypothetical protein
MGRHGQIAIATATFTTLIWCRSGHLGLKDLIFARNNEHLVAFHYAFAIAILQLFDLNTKVIVFANATLLLASGLMTYLAVRGSARTRVACLALPVLIVISLLNPSQTSNLLWEFQIWFYIDIALLAANALLVERFGFRAYPVVALLCLLATGSEAQGSFLWLAAGIQFFYTGLSAKSRASMKAGALILAIHVCAFLAAAWLLLHGKYCVPLPPEDASLLGHLRTALPSSAAVMASAIRTSHLCLEHCPLLPGPSALRALSESGLRWLFFG